MNRRNIVIFVVVVVVILLGIGVFNALRDSAKPKGSPVPTPVTATPTPKPVSTLDYLDSGDTEVRLTVRGRITAKESHVEETISVSLSRRNIYYIRAYSGAADPNLAFDNNQPAFEDFMRALNHAGFTAPKVQKKNAPKPADTEVGLCPGGQRYVYEIISGGESIYRAWSTSCGDPTTFGGTQSAIISLFHLQIPDYNKIASGLKP